MPSATAWSGALAWGSDGIAMCTASFQRYSLHHALLVERSSKCADLAFSSRVRARTAKTDHLLVGMDVGRLLEMSDFREEIGVFESFRLRQTYF
jgi:hypothetical protein